MEELAMREVVIVSAKRTPIGDYFGAFKDLTAVDLGVHALKAAIEAGGIEATQIEEVVGGQVYQAGCKGNTAKANRIRIRVFRRDDRFHD